MSDLAKKLFDGLNAVKDIGLSRLGDILPECGVEAQHQIGRGATEIASALFNQQGFVLYGHGQNTPSTEHQHQHEIEKDRGIER